jgi:hypothetical protein
MYALFHNARGISLLLQQPRIEAPPQKPRRLAGPGTFSLTGLRLLHIYQLDDANPFPSRLSLLLSWRNSQEVSSALFRLGTKVALVLSQLASDIGSAGQEARMISSEIRTFCTILNTLNDTMDKFNSAEYYAHCSDVIKDVTTASVEMFTEVLDAVATLRSMTDGKGARDGKSKFVSRLQWVVFQKPEIVVLRAAIEAYKSNITLMLGTVNIVEKVARRTSVQMLLFTLHSLTQVDRFHICPTPLRKRIKNEPL